MWPFAAAETAAFRRGGLHIELEGSVDDVTTRPKVPCGGVIMGRTPAAVAPLLELVGGPPRSGRLTPADKRWPRSACRIDDIRFRTNTSPI